MGSRSVFRGHLWHPLHGRVVIAARAVDTTELIVGSRGKVLQVQLLTDGERLSMPVLGGSEGGFMLTSFAVPRAA